MIQRPSKKDSENEILQMQNDFFAEQNRSETFEPAAKFIRMQRDGEPPAGANKQSEFARKRNLKKEAKDAEKNEVVEKPIENTVIGDIVEKKYRKAVPMEVDMVEKETGFPEVLQLSISAHQNDSKKSLFAQMLENQPQFSKDGTKAKLKAMKSNILEGSDAIQIHEENVQKLKEMSREDILKEQENLVQTMDPKLLQFLKSRKKVVKIEAPLKEEEDVKEENLVNKINLDILDEQGATNWLHFDVLEPEKLEWTKNIEKSIKDLKPGEAFEARFDWKGVLLPYVDKKSDKDDRELYLHGEEAGRPGYTLQELFRLARSNVLQQRISALNSIAGILNIFSQGFYDGVLELPISKLFFFLRFALDENTPAIVEAASRAIAYLFYNDTDETLLDTIFDTNYGIYQPEMGLKVVKSSNLEKKFSDMDLISKKGKKKVQFETKIDDDDEINRESMNDFHMAETDLIECILRTNILERIRYILFTLKPESPTVINCTKILIRLARTNEETALKIISNDYLIGNLIKTYLTSVDGYQLIEPQYKVLKLMRVLCSYDASFYGKYLEKFHLINLVKGYVFTRKDINVKLIQIQIETFRLLRVLLSYSKDKELYSELLPALLYLLEWHYQYLVYEQNGTFIIRQHCAALLSVIGYDCVQQLSSSSASYPINVDKFFACLCKWFSSAAKHGANEFSQKILLTSCLNAALKIQAVAPNQFKNFEENYFSLFIKSVKFDELARHLSSSPLLENNIEDRSQKIEPLPNLGGIIVTGNNSAHNLIITKTYPTFLLAGILNFIRTNEEYNQIFIQNENILNYLKKLAICKTDESKIASNWYLKTEIRFVLNILKAFKQNAEINLILKLSFNIILCLSAELASEIICLFDSVIFNKDFYMTECCSGEDMQRWKFIFKLKLQSILEDEEIVSCKNNFVESSWKNVVLKKHWPYSLVYAILDKLEKGTDRLELFQEEDVIKTTVLFSEVLERNGIITINLTEKLMYVMTMFLGPDSKFLDTNISDMLERKINSLKIEIGNEKFDFDTKLENKKSFQSLFQLVLDIFQSCSYGNPVFSTLIMIPLAQKYDIKWRNMIWSEYVAVLRFITCPDEQLFNSLDDYLYPEENDLTLVKFYAQALNSNLLRKGSVPYKIAEHHLNCYKSKHKKNKQ